MEYNTVPIVDLVITNLCCITMGVRLQIPTADYMDCAPRGGPAHKTKPCGARRCSVRPTRHREDIIKILRDLLVYV